MEEKDAKLVEDLSKYERISFIEFNELEYKYFVEKCMLNKEMSKILEMLIQGYTLTEIADKTKLAEATLSRRIALLKRKIKKVL